MIDTYINRRGKVVDNYDNGTIEQSILTFVRFKHIVSTSKEVDFLHLRKERNRFR